MAKSSNFNRSELKLFFSLLMIVCFISSCDIGTKKDVEKIISDRNDLIDYLVSSTWSAPLKLQDYNFNKEGSMNVKWETSDGDNLIAGGKWGLEKDKTVIKIIYNSSNTIRSGTEFLTIKKEDEYLILLGMDGAKYYRLGKKY